MGRYLKQRFLYAAICLSTFLISCSDSGLGEDSCELYIFFGKGSCIPCNLAIMRLLENDCFKKDSIPVTIVTYYERMSAQPGLDLLDFKVTQTGYDGIDFDGLPIHTVRRDHVQKPRIYLVNNDVIIFQHTNFEVPLAFNYNTCAVCRSNNSPPFSR